MNQKEIAEMAGVSVATVSNVINGKNQHISAETIERINGIIKETGFVINSIARGLKTKQTQIIGLVIPDISNPFYPEIARGVQDVASAYGFGVVFCNTDSEPLKEEECLSFLQSQRVDGIIQIRGASSSRKLCPNKIPYVIIDGSIEGAVENEGKIYVEVQEAMFEATMIMVEKGCRNIAYISSTKGSDFGYRKALEQANLSYNQEQVYLDDFSPKTGFDGLMALYGKIEFDGVVCGNDLIAIGVLNALRDLKVEVPETVKVIGLDNIYLSKYTNPKLTTMAQPTYDMGKEAAKMLIDHIVDKTPLFTKQMEHKLILRETV